MHYLLLAILAIVFAVVSFFLFETLVDHTTALGKKIDGVKNGFLDELARLRQGLEDITLRFQPVGAIVPTVGRIVHYILPDGPSTGQIRPAIIVRIWAEDGKATVNTAVQLQVFMDGAGAVTWNDGSPNVVWKTSVLQGLSNGTWHSPQVNRAKFADDMTPPNFAPSPQEQPETPAPPPAAEPTPAT